MTHTPSPTVIQADREAAASIFDAYGAPNYATLCTQNSPLVDKLIAVRVLAAHRELGERRGRIGDSDLKDFGSTALKGSNHDD